MSTRPEGPTPPTGTITFLLTDIEGSTRLLDRVGAEAFAALLERHNDILRTAVAAHGGYELRTEGDSFLVAFERPTQGVAAAVAAQRALKSHPWPDGNRIKVRMGLHTGEALWISGDYVGIAVPQAARTASAGHGGQILVSHATQELVQGALDGVGFLDLGEHMLKDLARPARLYQVVAEGLDENFPALATIDARRHNLPAPLTALIGRSGDLEAVEALLGDPETRLVTITGPGGVGKTRLAVETARRLVDDYPDGAWLVQLASVTDPRLLLRAVAGELNVTEEPGRELADVLAARLAGTRALLVLDNLEQVIAAAPDIATLLERCPGVDVLATSREVLRLRGEREYALHPLAMPSLGDLPPAELLSTYDAVSLFIDRAVAADPNFELTPSNAAAIAEICTRLDGLPLALELAAARVRTLAPQEMLPRLSNRLALLTGGARDLPERHRTLREAIAWSYDLLDEPDRRAFRGLSFFSGGCTVEAAAGILGDGMLDGITSLLDKSLVQRVEGGGDPRFDMLDTVREYAFEQLVAAPEAEEVRTSHASWFAALASKAASRLTHSDQGPWLERLDAEHDNLRVALWSLLDTADTTAAAALASDLSTYWYVRGHLKEGSRWLDAILAAEAGPTPARAQALAARATFALSQSDYVQASEAFDEHLRLVRGLGDRGAEASTLNALGRLARDLGELDVAAGRFAECVRIATEVGDRHLATRGLANLGTVHRIRGDLPEAVRLSEEALAAARDVDDPGAICDCLTGLATAVRLNGEIDRARGLYEEALAIARDRGTKPGVMRIVNSLGHIALRNGDVAGARALYGEGMALAQDIGDRRAQSAFLNGMGRAAEEAGDDGAAREYFEDALALKRVIGDRIGEALSMFFLGSLLARNGDNDEAERSLRDAYALREELGLAEGAAEALVAIGRIELARGDKAAAEATLTQALAGRPKDADEIERLLAEARS